MKEAPIVLFEKQNQESVHRRGAYDPSQVSVNKNYRLENDWGILAQYQAHK